MDEAPANAVECPLCGHAMDEGKLAVSARHLAFADATWEPVDRIWGGKQRILSPGPLGLHTRPMWRCPKCETLLIPPGAAT